MQLLEDGKVNLTDEIGLHLANIPEKWKSLTIDELLSHSSGLPDYYQWPNKTPETPEAALSSVKNKPFIFNTGDKNQYNQTNYLLLKMIIEKVTNTNFLNIMSSRIIKKLDLRQTFYGGEFAIVPSRASTYRATENGLFRNGPLDQPDYMFSSSGLNTSPEDIAKLFQALLQGKLMSKKSLATMWAIKLLNSGEVSRFVNGWEFFKHNTMNVFGHGGGNRVDVRHFIDTSDNNNITVIYFTNGYHDNNFWPGSVSIGLADILLKAQSPAN
jgi:CubicO group peptidase (beta-lactamase class C family)